MLARHLREAAVAALRAAAGVDAAVEARPVVGPDDHFAAIAAAGGVGGNARAASDVAAGGVVLDAAALKITADQHRASAGFARRIDAGAAKQADALAEHPNLSATGAGRGTRCIQRAAHLNHAAPAAIEIDFAIAPVDAPRAHHAIHAQHGIEQGVPGAGLQRHPTAIGEYQAGVLDQRRRHASVHLITHEAVPVEIDVDPPAGDEAGGSARRGDGAGVAHLGADQRHAAACCRGDPPFVAHAARTARCHAEDVAAAHQVGGVGREGGCHEAAHIDHRVATEDDARRVDEEHRTERADFAEDLGGIIGRDPIDGHRGGGGLVEAHRFVGADVERAPVDRRFGTALIDHQPRRACRIHGGLPRHDGGIGGQREGVVAQGHHQRCRQWPQAGAETGFVEPGGFFCLAGLGDHETSFIPFLIPSREAG